MANVYIDIMTSVLWEHPEIPVPTNMCIWRLDYNVGCDCDGLDHSVDWQVVCPECKEQVDCIVLTTHVGPRVESCADHALILT